MPHHILAQLPGQIVSDLGSLAEEAQIPGIAVIEKDKALEGSLSSRSFPP